MLELILYLDPFDSKDFLVYWEIVNKLGKNLSDYRLHVYRAIGVDSKYQLISLPLDPSTSNFYRDKKTSKLRKWLDVHYKVEVERLSDGKREIYGPVRVERNATASDRLIISHKRKQYVRFGNPVVVGKLNQEGIRCACWNKILGKSDDSNCTMCHGTGYSKGYTNFYFTRMFFDAERKANPQISSEEQPLSRTFRCSNFPILNPGDLIIDRANRRYTVDVIDPVIPHGVILEQVLRVTEVNKTDVEMDVPIPEDFRKLAWEL